MKIKNYLFMVLLLTVALTGCKKGPMYIYIDTQGDDPKVSFIDSEDDVNAYNKAFENYSNARFYPIFSEFEKTHRYIVENEGNNEACEADESAPVPADANSDRGSVITTGDEVTTIDGMGSEPSYEELSEFNEPNFILYKIESSSARKAAQDYIDKKISYEEFEKRMKGSTTPINLYKKNFQACATIDRNLFDKLIDKLRTTIAKIDREAAERKAEVEAEKAADAAQGNTQQ